MGLLGGLDFPDCMATCKAYIILSPGECGGWVCPKSDEYCVTFRRLDSKRATLCEYMTQCPTDCPKCMEAWRYFPAGEGGVFSTQEECTCLAAYYSYGAAIFSNSIHFPEIRDNMFDCSKFRALAEV